jgi:hypothetical protein
MENNKIVELLTGVKAIEAKIDALTAERDELRVQIAAAMNAEGLAQKMVELPEGRFKVTRRHVTTVKYDEAVLRERLGARIKAILDLDYRKVKEHRGAVLELLGDKLVDVGKVSQIRVREAVASGAVSAAEFKGTFQKTESDRLTISRVRDTGSLPPSADAPY